MIAAGYSWVPFWRDISYGFGGEFFYSWNGYADHQTYAYFESRSWARNRDNMSWTID